MIDFNSLAGELIDSFQQPITGCWSNSVFSGLASKVFEYQYGSNPIYARYAKKKGVTPANLKDWKEIPPVPTLAFKEFPIISGDSKAVERVFETSGTSLGPRERGKHHIIDLALYRASLMANMRHQFYSDENSLPLLFALVKDPVQSPSSSLSFMLGEALVKLSMGRGGFYVDEHNRLQYEKLAVDLKELELSGEPVLLTGTAFAFVHWMDWLGNKRLSFELPRNSRIMETGGFKARSREVSRIGLYKSLADFHGVPISSIVSEYGMTEMLSQLYEQTVVTQGTGEILHLGYMPPPWLRSLVLDVNTLAALPAGQEGVLCHFDLANLGSAMAVLTEDVGVTLENGGIRLVGRLDGAEERGCSLAMNEYALGNR